MVRKLMSNNSPLIMKPIIEQLVNNTMQGQDCKVLVQQMLNTTVDLKTMKTPNSTRKSPTGNQVNLLLRAFLNDGISTERLDKYATTTSGLNSGDTSNIQKMLFQVASKYNCLATTEQGMTCDQNMLVNALDTIVQAFVDDQTGSKQTTSKNPFDDVQPTATATTTIEQIDEEFEEEEEEEEEEFPSMMKALDGYAMTIENISALTNEIVAAHESGRYHPALIMVKHRLLKQEQTTTTRNGTSKQTVQMYMNGKNKAQNVYSLENGTAKTQDSNTYFLTWQCMSVGFNVLGLYSVRGGGKRNAPTAWASSVIADGFDKVSVGALGCAVMHLAEPHMIDKNGNQLGFTHDLRKYVSTDVANQLKGKIINVALANSPAMDGNYEVAKDFNLPEYNPYNRAVKPTKARTLL